MTARATSLLVRVRLDAASNAVFSVQRNDMAPFVIQSLRRQFPGSVAGRPTKRWRSLGSRAAFASLDECFDDARVRAILIDVLLAHPGYMEHCIAGSGYIVFYPASFPTVDPNVPPAAPVVRRHRLRERVARDVFRHQSGDR